MEDNNNKVNLPNVGAGAPGQEEKKKKGLAGLLFGKSAVHGKGLFGPGGALAQLLASKTAIVGLLLGITAVAGLATSLMTKKAPAGGGSGEALAFKPYESYSPGMAQSGVMSFPLPNATGNPAYKDELYKASVNPEAGVEDSYVAFAEEAEPKQAATKAGKLNSSGGASFSAASAGGGGSGGGVLSSMSGNVKDDLSKDAKASGNDWSVKGKGVASGSGRAASSLKSAGRAGHSGLKTGGLSKAGQVQGVPLATGLERAKASLGTTFGEDLAKDSGVGSVEIPSTDVGAGSGDQDSDEFELPEGKEDTDESGGGGGGGGGGTTDANDGDTAAKAKKLEELKTTLGEQLQELISLSTEPAKLCATNGSAYTYLTQVSETLQSNLTELLELLDEMHESGLITDEQYNNWRCNVILKSQELVLGNGPGGTLTETAYMTYIAPFCQAYTLKEAYATKFEQHGCEEAGSNLCNSLYNKWSDANSKYLAEVTTVGNSLTPLQNYTSILVSEDEQSGFPYLLSNAANDDELCHSPTCKVETQDDASTASTTTTTTKVETQDDASTASPTTTTTTPGGSGGWVEEVK